MGKPHCLERERGVYNFSMYVHDIFLLPASKQTEKFPSSSRTRFKRTQLEQLCTGEKSQNRPFRRPFALCNSKFFVFNSPPASQHPIRIKHQLSIKISNHFSKNGQLLPLRLRHYPPRPPLEQEICSWLQHAPGARVLGLPRLQSRQQLCIVPREMWRLSSFQVRVLL